MSRILIIDDDPLYTEVLGDYLGIHGFEVVRVELGKEGLSAVESDSFDLILVDWQLPDMSGLDVLEQLRQKQISTPIIVVTGHRDTQSLTQALDAGAADVLRKPFGPPQLLERIRLICGGSGPAQNLNLK